jgi:hypothetical protein
MSEMVNDTTCSTAPNAGGASQGGESAFEAAVRELTTRTYERAQVARDFLATRR